MNMLYRQDKTNIVMNIEKKLSGMARLMSQESTLLHAHSLISKVGERSRRYFWHCSSCSRAKNVPLGWLFPLLNPILIILSLGNFHHHHVHLEFFYGVYFNTRLPLLVQRCNGILPGWVIWKLMWFAHANLPFRPLVCVRTVDPHWGEWQNSFADFNPNNNHVNAAPKQASFQTTSRLHHHVTPKQNYCKKNKRCDIGRQIFKNKKALL